MITPIEWKEVFFDNGPPGSRTFMHITRPLVAILGQEKVDLEDGHEPRWHLSVSHKDRVPTWEELGIARDALLPEDIHFMIPHPPRRFWLNYNHRVLHLWELRDPGAITQFEWEGEAAQKAGFGTPSSGEAVSRETENDHDGQEEGST